MFITRRIDLSAGADGCCPISAIGSTCANVLVQELHPMLIGDVFGPHPCGGKHCIHTEVCVTGFPKVLINGRPVVYSGAPLAPGDISATGSPTVIIG